MNDAPPLRLSPAPTPHLGHIYPASSSFLAYVVSPFLPISPIPRPRNSELSPHAYCFLLSPRNEASYRNPALPSLFIPGPTGSAFAFVDAGAILRLRRRFIVLSSSGPKSNYDTLTHPTLFTCLLCFPFPFPSSVRSASGSTVFLLSIGLVVLPQRLNVSATTRRSSGTGGRRYSLSTRQK